MLNKSLLTNLLVSFSLIQNQFQSSTWKIVVYKLELPLFILFLLSTPSQLSRSYAKSFAKSPLMVMLVSRTRRTGHSMPLPPLLVHHSLNCFSQCYLSACLPLPTHSRSLGAWAGWVSSCFGILLSTSPNLCTQKVLIQCILKHAVFPSVKSTQEATVETLTFLKSMETEILYISWALLCKNSETPWSSIWQSNFTNTIFVLFYFELN